MVTKTDLQREIELVRFNRTVNRLNLAHRAWTDMITGLPPADWQPERIETLQHLQHDIDGDRETLVRLLTAAMDECLDMRAASRSQSWPDVPNRSPGGFRASEVLAASILGILCGFAIGLCFHW